jgi:Aspartate/tyrosine/aromatic aminotransferase
MVSPHGRISSSFSYHKVRLFCEDLAETKVARDIGVAIVPGSSFYIGSGQGNTRVRFNFAKKEETMREAARRLLRFQS